MKSVKFFFKVPTLTTEVKTTLATRKFVICYQWFILILIAVKEWLFGNAFPATAARLSPGAGLCAGRARTGRGQCTLT
ncbi:MAG TPA: hypothetical protein VF490_10710 [Chryseosolibacter sp.]